MSFGSSLNNKLLLFDIDGTLVSWAGLAGRVFECALSHAAGHPVESVNYSFAGRTDPEIARDLLLRAGVALDGIDDKVTQVLDTYVHLFERAASDGHQARVQPGVKCLLARLESEPRAHLGLLTGNVERGASIKLAYLGIDRYFQVGAFGSDSADRNALVPFAVDRARHALGITFAGADIVVIGDTPRDVECAKEHSARAVGVATGPHAAGELLESGADYVFDDLSDTDDVVRVLLETTHE